MKLSFVAVIDSNNMIFPSLPQDHMLIKMWSIKEDTNGRDKQLMKEGRQEGQ